ncbi:hypothetical protein C494_14071 [Natronorubrum bangense JCM 10635]|uniref:Inner membrane protein YgaP-like transmembrane domain-containing protein n=1 Tax=Natronorubrum bangense JCM 10635 TaxID=1227500 RepID=L9WCF8_9EURY|nr:hypothetical protein C494_14071 [Natronorubrum bangense JCM 10635]
MISVEKNVGGADRTVRIAAGLVFVGAMMVTRAVGDRLEKPTQGIVTAVLPLVAFVLLGTARDERYPGNRALGQSTDDERGPKSR